MVNLYQRQRHAGMTIACCMRNATINVVVCHAVSQQAAAADCHQPFCVPLLAHSSSHKTSMRRNLTTTIVFDEPVVKGETAAVTESLNSSEALFVSSHAVM